MNELFMRLISSLNINSYKMEFINLISDTCMFRTKICFIALVFGTA